jgi:protein involved in polysaccharide export with SLBB domain
MMRTPLPTALVALLIFVGSARAQSTDPYAQGLTMERAELVATLERLEVVSESSAYSGRLRESARRDVERIRDRLANGDFRVGDRVVLRVEGEPDIPPTLPVEPGPRITLPVIGPITLAGVLRSELQDHLTRELGRFIQNPVVEAKGEVRISIQGGVGAPGFYTVPADILVGEALMLAGGPGQTNLDELRIERGEEVLWEGDELQAVIADGLTLDQMNLRAGDQIMLPVDDGEGLGIGWGDVLRWGVGIATSVLIGTQVFF